MFWGIGPVFDVVNLLQAQAPGKSKPIPGLPAPARYDEQGEITYIGQAVLPFRSRYQGPNSFPSQGVAAATETATWYLGARVRPNLEFYVNPEIATGAAPGAGNGLGGYSNGDLIGQPTEPSVFNLARVFGRWRIPMKQGKDKPVGRENVGRAPNIIAGPVPQHRLVVQLGKFAVTDVFDVNSYANNPRTQFINNAFVNGLAFDYPQDDRGYDLGASVSLVNPNYSVRFGTFAMPTSPGSSGVAYGSSAHGEQLELDLNPQVLRTPTPPMVVRLIGFVNDGTMGTYANAIGAALPGTAPSLSAVRADGTVRTGFGINLEQPLADGGNTGVFARVGWADGNIESDAFAEADQAYSLGVQVSGARWKRKSDFVGLAMGWNGISAIHQQYLAAGGQGLTLGDGGLNYGEEQILEAYYLYQYGPRLAVTGDFQWIDNPGYNRDRGPAPVFSVRLHYTF